MYSDKNHDEKKTLFLNSKTQSKFALYTNRHLFVAAKNNNWESSICATYVYGHGWQSPTPPDQTNKNLYKTKCLWCRYSNSTNSKLHNPIKICIIDQQTFFCCCKKQLIGRVAYMQLMLMDMADKAQPPRSNKQKPL